MTINCKGTLIDFETPKVMGILNSTPDSFFDAGKYNKTSEWVDRAGTMLEQGADFIDIGGYSSKPNADYVSEEQERDRVLLAVDAVLAAFPNTILSIDTFRSSVARAAIEYGAAIINDISAGKLDVEMLPTIAELQVPYIMMHMRGTPQTMQQLTNYGNLLQEMLYYFSGRIAAARQLGINDLIIDPGFGFAKTKNQNFELIRKTELFKMLNVPMLIGISRKSMIYKTFGTTPQEALNGTTALHMIALQKGANILRVHDVKEAVECIQLHQLIK